jgi:hypothetical protein
VKSDYSRGCGASGSRSDVGYQIGRQVRIVSSAALTRRPTKPSGRTRMAPPFGTPAAVASNCAVDASTIETNWFQPARDSPSETPRRTRSGGGTCRSGGGRLESGLPVKVRRRLHWPDRRARSLDTKRRASIVGALPRRHFSPGPSRRYFTRPTVGPSLIRQRTSIYIVATPGFLPIPETADFIRRVAMAKSIFAGTFGIAAVLLAARSVNI